VRKLEGKEPLGELMHTWEDNIEKGLQRNRM
jgi:hypothetical protein